MISRLPGKQVLALALVGGVSLSTASGTIANAQARQLDTHGNTKAVATVRLTAIGQRANSAMLCGATFQSASKASPLGAASTATDLLGALGCASTGTVGAGATARGIDGPIASFSLDESLRSDFALLHAKHVLVTTAGIARVPTTKSTTGKHTTTHTYTKAKSTTSHASVGYSAPAAGIGPWTPVPGHPSYALGNYAGDPYSSVYGTCTWYAWYRRGSEPLLRLGNAAQWSANASKFGLRVGSTPVVGATAVFQPGVQGAGSGGHAAHVEAILSGGWFIISEMNFYWNGGGFGKVDYRYVHTGAGVSFIY